MKKIKNIMVAFTGVLALASCNKIISKDEIDPNQPTTVTPNLILGTVLSDVSGTGSQGSLGGINSTGSVQQWNQYFCSNYGYYGTNIYSWTSGPFDGYEVLKNVVQMEKEATSRGAAAVNPYAAVGKFVRAWYYYHMTSMFGDIPLTDALEGAANPTPSYTPQKQVFQYVLNILDSANTDFAALVAANDNSLSASQDIFYSGNLAEWQKLVNTFKLRVLISLSLQSADADLQVPAQFAKIYNNPTQYPIFTSTADDFKFTYLNPPYTTFGLTPSNYGSIAQRDNSAYTPVHALTSMQDPRVYLVCEPAKRLVDSLNTTPTDFRVFYGAPTGETLEEMYDRAGQGYISFINFYRFFTSYTGFPDILVGYNELEFNIAEAMNRGWITGSAETWYQNGIITALAYYGITPSQTNYRAYFNSGSGPTDTTGYAYTFNWSTYYAQPLVKYASGSTGIQQIITQKYLSMFDNSGWEPYFNWRRTGFPAFQGGSGVGNNGTIPLRWTYPYGEQSYNAKNWAAAISSQGFSADDLNQTMWLLK
jgi:hypothetical protein